MMLNCSLYPHGDSVFRKHQYSASSRPAVVVIHNKTSARAKYRARRSKRSGSLLSVRGIWRNQPRSDDLATALCVNQQLAPTGVLIAGGLLVGMSLLFFTLIVAALPTRSVVEPVDQTDREGAVDGYWGRVWTR